MTPVSDNTASAPLVAALRRIRRILQIAGAVIVAVVLVLGAWGLTGWPSAGVASLTVAALIGVQIAILAGLGGRPDLLVGLVAGGYIAKIGLLLAAILGARAIGLDVKVIGFAAIAAVLVTMLTETIVLARARIPHVDPPVEGA